MSARLLRHGEVGLALHPLRDVPAGGHRLLLLHGLGERSPSRVPEWAATWTGGVWALDFAGHGGSDIAVGGGYDPEILLADADAALAEIGRAAVAGRGVGAYVALLLAGARPALISGAVLMDGPGLAGGGPEQVSLDMTSAPAESSGATPDPLALAELTRDVRPPALACDFAQAARGPILVAAKERPSWVRAILEIGAAQETTLAMAIDKLEVAR